MKGAWRFAIAASTAGLWLSPAAALAQAAQTSAPPPASNTPATDTIGPSELQNFTLKGTVTRPADVTAAPTSARPRTAQVRPPSLSTSSAGSPQSHSAARVASPTPSPAPASAGTRATTASRTPAPIVAPPVQNARVLSAPAPTPAPAAAASTAEPTSPPTNPFAPLGRLPLWPWIAAAIALAGGAGFLLWRRRPREMAMAGPQFDLLVPAPFEPEPEPPPLPRAPAPAPPAAPPQRRPAAASGIVASRLRPTLELGFHPLRCQVDDDQVAIEFELELFNAGTAPARAVLAEASMLNAGATQEQDLAVFFANPNGVGERLAVIQPMKRVSFRSQVVAPRNAVQEYELAGRRAFVPVIAFNALYEWSGGSAQSSAAYLVGRDTQKDKLGPLRLDQGAREYRGLGARPLPSAVRT